MTPSVPSGTSDFAITSPKRFSEAQSRIDTSNYNVVTGNVAYDNANSGVEIEGGSGNVVSGNTPNTAPPRSRRWRLTLPTFTPEIRTSASVTKLDPSVSGIEKR